MDGDLQPARTADGTGAAVTDRPDAERLLAVDRGHVWHPYASMTDPAPVRLVESADGVRLRIARHGEVIDGMSSWWCAIHGYRHPALDAAAHAQLESMSHVLFGGLTHIPAIGLVQRLLALTPDGTPASSNPCGVGGAHGGS